jgi:hypothetical protein
MAFAEPLLMINCGWHSRRAGSGLGWRDGLFAQLGAAVHADSRIHGVRLSGGGRQRRAVLFFGRASRYEFGGRSLLQGFFVCQIFSAFTGRAIAAERNREGARAHVTTAGLFCRRIARGGWA